MDQLIPQNSFDNMDIMNTMTDQLTNTLIESGYNQKEISNAMHDVKTRMSWNIKSKCLIFSRTNNIWFYGEIVNIYITHQNIEFLKVKYNNKNIKSIQRFSESIRPIHSQLPVRNEIIQFITKELKKAHTEIFQQLEQMLQPPHPRHNHNNLTLLIDDIFVPNEYTHSNITKTPHKENHKTHNYSPNLYINPLPPPPGPPPGYASGSSFSSIISPPAPPQEPTHNNYHNDNKHVAPPPPHGPPPVTQPLPPPGPPPGAPPPQYETSASISYHSMSTPPAEEENKCTIKDKCECFKSVLAALDIYDKIDMNNNLNESKMMKYFQEEYKTFLDDYIHIVTKHNYEIEDVYKYVQSRRNNRNSCELSKCNVADRHQRDNKHNDSETNGTINAKVVFWRDIIDSCHCYFYHLYDFGLRKFTRISNKQSNISNSRRYGSGKFSIKQHNQHKSDTTFMDGLFEYMKQKNVMIAHLSRIKDILDQEEYDTDALTMDIFKTQNDKQSNIRGLLKNDTRCGLTHRYVCQIKLSSSSFKIGYRFYYWEYYKNRDETYKNVQVQQNINNHCGYTEKELYVETKYSTFKQEVLQNTIFRLKCNAFNISMTKAKNYIQTEKAKQITAIPLIMDDHYHYGIIKGTPLSVWNILSVLLYTDYSELCTAFSGTFRTKTKYEMLSGVKSRNQEFANWSRILRETIEYFGNMGYDEYLNDRFASDEQKNNYNFESGPFYCGLNSEMIIPEFNIRLNPPTSTTKQIDVAQKFAGDEGLIITLNNNGYDESYYLFSWNCSWLSDYAGEDERVWMGGESTIRIESIRIVNGAIECGTFITPMYYFDCMITGVCMHESFKGSHIKNKDKRILQDLINHETKDAESECTEYIQNTFHAFTQNKKEIVFNLCYIDDYFEKLQDLIMYDVCHGKYDKHKGKFVNLFKEIVFDLFENVESIVIYTTMDEGDGQAKFRINILSLISLLEQLHLSHDITITIRAQHEYEYTFNDKYLITKLDHVDVSWLRIVWNELSHAIKRQCFEKNCKVSFVKDVGIKYEKWEMLEDYISIKKNASKNQ